MELSKKELPKIPMDRKMNKITLQVMLRQLEKETLINSLIGIIHNICDKDEDLKNITHTIITQVHAENILTGKSKLEGLDFNKEHKAEVIAALKKCGWKEPFDHRKDYYGPNIGP